MIYTCNYCNKELPVNMYYDESVSDTTMYDYQTYVCNNHKYPINYFIEKYNGAIDFYSMSINVCNYDVVFFVYVGEYCARLIFGKADEPSIDLPLDMLLQSPEEIGDYCAKLYKLKAFL